VLYGEYGLHRNALPVARNSWRARGIWERCSGGSGRNGAIRRAESRFSRLGRGRFAGGGGAWFADRRAVLVFARPFPIRRQPDDFSDTARLSQERHRPHGAPGNGDAAPTLFCPAAPPRFLSASRSRPRPAGIGPQSVLDGRPAIMGSGARSVIHTPWGPAPRPRFTACDAVASFRLTGTTAATVMEPRSDRLNRRTRDSSLLQSKRTMRPATGFGFG